MKKMVSVFAIILILIGAIATPMTAEAWNASPAAGVNMELKLIGMMNVNIFGENNTLSNVNTASDGSVLSGITLYAKKFGGTWPHQVGDGPYTTDQINSLFAVDAVTDCMTAENNELAVYMLYDLGNPEDEQVQENMRILGIDDINLYYSLMSEKIQLTIDAIAGGGKGHETAITAYYRYSSDWRSFAKSKSSATRSEMLDMGIAAPDENVYFYETVESQKMRDGSDSIPGIRDESVSQYIDENESYSLPTWEDTNEDASWNIVNPVPTCNIYSRWYDDFSAKSDYQTCFESREEKIIELYGEDYTIGQFNAVTGDPEKDNVMFAKNWEWEANPYYSTKTSGVYGTTSADKSHLGYGEYCPASVTSYHNFYIPQNQANDDAPSRFMTVMVRETGTVCGLDGCGHWHTVKVSSASKSEAVYFQPEVNDDSVVIDYGLSVDIPIDANDWVWTTDPYSQTNILPDVDKVEISAGNRDDENSYTTDVVTGKFGTLELTDWSKQWGEGHCNVRYTPKVFVDEPDVFYYKVYPVDTEKYEPLTGKITVIPATLVYYEDNFSTDDNGESSGFTGSLVYSGNWSYVDSSGQVITGTAVNGNQSAVNREYGYEKYYENNLGYSNGTAHQGKLGDSLSFTFKGTGCDIIMRTDALDGSVKYSVTKSDTRGGTQTEATSLHTVSCRNNNGQTLYQLPVISLHYDDYAYYTVTLSGVTSRYIYIDGIRIYNPLGEYGSDGADNETMEAYYDEAEKKAVTVPVYNAIYDSQAFEGEKIGFIGVYSNWNEWYGTEKNIDGEVTDFSSLLSIGPNNEIYLAPGQSIVFNVQNTSYENLILGVEAKAVSSPTTLTMTVDGDSTSVDCRNVDTNTAMYYHYTIKNTQIGESGTIRIENSGSEVLSISNLKYSKILAVSGTFDYEFIDENGAPVSGVVVSIYDKSGSLKYTATSDESGVAKITDTAAKEYKVSFKVPSGKSFISGRKVTISEDVTGDAARFVLYDCVLGIGSAKQIFMSPSVSFDAKNIIFSNTATGTTAGSVKLDFAFDGVSGGSGYINGNNYLKGNLSLVICNDGSLSWSFDGSGKTNGKSFSAGSGKLPAGTATFTEDGLSIDFNKVLQKLTTYDETNSNFKFTDVSLLFKKGSFTLQAFENTDPKGEGEKGEAATVTIGAEPVYIATTSANAEFLVTDNNGNPLSGAVVTSDDGVSATSDDNGIVQLSGLKFGERTFTVTPPEGYEKPDDISVYFDPVDNSFSGSFSMHHLASAEFTFTYEDGTPASGVTVTTDDGVSFVTDEQGRAYSDCVTYGDRTFSFKLPTGYASIDNLNNNFTYENNSLTASYVLKVLNLTIGSGSTGTETSASVNATNIIISDYRPADTAGSYIITYDFDGVAGGTGYVDSKTYLSGTLSLLVNSDGTATYNFEGSGISNGKKSFSSKSGSTGTVTVTDDAITINMVTLMREVTGITNNDFKFTTTSAYISNGSVIGITAFEGANATGNYGDTAAVTVSTSTATTLAERFDQVIQQLRATFERVLSFFRSLFNIEG